MTPFWWVSLELLRTFIFTGFPWELLGYSQFERIAFIQIADTLGVYGVSFLLALGNATVFLVLAAATGLRWRRQPVPAKLALTATGVCLMLLGANWFYGGWRVREVDRTARNAPTLRVAVVQGNIEQGRKWDPAFQLEAIDTHIRLSAAAPGSRPDLVVWPESAAPFYFMHEKAPTRLVLNGVRRTGIAHLIGSPAFKRRADGEVDYFNRAYLIQPDGGIGGFYDKVHLVPFGEYTPFKEYLPFIGKMVAHVGDFEPGAEGNVLFLEDIGLGIQICYEIIFPALSRAMTRNGAAVLVNITNDAWYGLSAGPYQHFSMVVFRAVENRRSLARAANTGISGFIDPAGRVLNATRLFVETALTGELPLLTTRTAYTRFGDFFAIACAFVALLSIIRFSKIHGKFKSRQRR
jgi:apolipoprotein N-acyltransferase